MERLLLIVKESENGVRLDRFIKRYYPLIPQGLIEKSLKNNLIKLEGKKSKSNIRVNTGQNISIASMIIPEDKAPKTIKKISENVFKDFIKTIIFEDDNILVINKPSGLATQGGSKINISIDDIIRDKYNEARLVHRLDKDTSGLLVIAKNIEVANILTKYFREKTITKKYLALTCGSPRELQGMIDKPISKIKSNNFERMDESSNGQKSITYYKVIDFIRNQLSLIEFIPITGRTHQIRIHAKLMNIPIVGDKKYGYHHNSLSINQNFLHLHSWQIKFENIFGKNYHFTAPLPKYLLEHINEYGLNLL